MAAVNVWSKWTAFCNSWLALGYCILAERTAEPLAEYVFCSAQTHIHWSAFCALWTLIGWKVCQ